MQQIAITDFDFTAFSADQDSLIKAWLPEIEDLPGPMYLMIGSLLF